MATKNECFTCSQSKKKSKGSVICIGCQNPFCREHHQEHRKVIEKDFDSLIEQHNMLRENLFNENNDQNSTMSKLLEKIDNWEKEMIQNIKTTARATKTHLTQIMDEEKNQLKQSFKSMADELKTNQPNNDYVETDLQEWQKQLNDFKQKLEQLQISNNDFIDVDITSIDWKNMINVQQRKDVRIQTKHSSSARPTKTRKEKQLTCRYCHTSFIKSSGYDSDYCSATCCKQSVDTSSSSDEASGCFYGNCVVLLTNGLTKLVRDIRKGDVLKTPDGSKATVTYVVKILRKNKSASLVSFVSGLIITTWHPIRINGKWIFPHNVGDKKVIECQEVYNFALDTGHIIIVNDIECATLGHGFKGEVIEHPYYGTSKVLDDLHAVDVSNNGFIELLPNSTIRDNETGLVSGICGYSATFNFKQLSNLSISV